MVVLSLEEQTELSDCGQSGRGLLPYQQRMRFTVRLMHLQMAQNLHSCPQKPGGVLSGSR